MFLRREGTNPRNSRLIFITGGARSGKSRFALGLAQGTSFRNRIYVATGVACDAEMRRRITRHRQERKNGWLTLEEPRYLPEKLPKRYLSSGNLILLDCLAAFVTNLLLSKIPHAAIEKRAKHLLATLRHPGLTSILVSNEVGLGLVPDHPLGREFRDILGRVNQHAASHCDEVYFLVSGIPMRLK